MKKYDFIVLFDVKNGNPNGDPDAGNMPRIDPVTGIGLVTDACLKRKIRNYVDLKKQNQIEIASDGSEIGYKIFIKGDAPLNRKAEEAYASIGGKGCNPQKVKKEDPDFEVKVRDFMCKNYFDIRTFGGVMTAFTRDGLKGGQIRGPVQIGFSRSIDPISPQAVTITRMAITTEKDAEKKTTEMGKKHIVPYGLYVVEGHISARLAEQTGFSDSDIELLWESILNMFTEDHSAARGEMAVRELIVFEHDSDIGNAPAHKLFERLTVKKSIPTPKDYSDYNVQIDDSNLPKGITMRRMA